MSKDRLAAFMDAVIAIIKLIGMVLAATVYPPAMVYSVLLAMLWMFVPVEKFYQPKK